MDFLQSSEFIQSFSANFGEMAVAFTGRLISAAVVLVVGWYIIKYINRGINKWFDHAEFDPALEAFVGSLAGIAMKIILFIIVASMLGVQMTSFIAILGAAGLAIGLALQGSLSNFAGGVLILAFKPFSIGDYIETDSNYNGTVKDIKIFYTILETFTHQIITIPNGDLSNNPVTNYTKMGIRRTNLTVGIDYNDDIKKAKEVLEEIVSKEKRFLAEPAPQIVVAELGESSVNFYVRATASAEDYWGAYFDMVETIKKRFDEEGLSFPFPQRTLHITKDSE